MSANDDRSQSSGTPRGAAFRSAPTVGRSFRRTDCPRFYSGLEWPWNFLLRGDHAPAGGGRGTDLYHALRHHLGGKHARSVSWAGVALFDSPIQSFRGKSATGRSTNWDRRAVRLVRIFARQRTDFSIRKGVDRQRRTGDVRPRCPLKPVFEKTLVRLLKRSPLP
jgi:hypothetical protein